MNNKPTGEKQEVINNNQKQIQTKLTKGLLDMIILQYLEKESMHGYQLIILLYWRQLNRLLISLNAAAYPSGGVRPTRFHTRHNPS